VPVRPDLWVEGPDGRPLAGEVRHVRGVPTRAAAEALAAVEEAALERLLLYFADAADGERVPALSFTYEGTNEELLALLPLLDVARAARPLLDDRLLRWDLLTRAGFARAARARVREAEVVREVRGVLETLTGGAVVRADLDEPYRHYLVSPDHLDETLAAALEAARAAPPLRLEEIDDPRPLLWPTLGPAAEPRLLAAANGRVEPLDADALRRLRLDPAEALAAALRNMEAATAADPEGMTFYATDAGLVLAAEFADPSTAARILSPTVRRFLRDHVASGAGLAAAMPHRDALLAAPATPKGLAWLRAETARRYAEALEPLRISDRVYTVGESGLDPMSFQGDGDRDPDPHGAA
jgi:hypothetical protein